MPPLAEKTLAPETAADLIARAEELKLFSLEGLAEFFSINLETAATLLAPFLALLGIDLDLDTTNTSFNPREHQEVRITFKRSDDGACVTPADRGVYTADELTDALAFKPPDDYHGATPETEEQEEEFERFFKELDCDTLAAEAYNRLGYMADAVEIGEGELDLLAHDDNMYKMARDVLKYKEEHGLCK